MTDMLAITTHDALTKSKIHIELLSSPASSDGSEDAASQEFDRNIDPIVKSASRHLSRKGCPVVMPNGVGISSPGANTAGGVLLDVNADQVVPRYNEQIAIPRGFADQRRLE
jgi:hypothetical protein